MRKIIWANIPNTIYVTNLLVSNGLFGLVKVAGELELKFDHTTLTESINKGNIPICTWLLNRGLKLNKTLILNYSDINFHDDMFLLLKSYSHKVDLKDNHMCEIYFG